MPIDMTYKQKKAIMNNDEEKIKNKEKHKYKCKHCNYTTGSSGNISRHKRRIHDDKQVLCNQCSKPFKDPYEMRQHIRSKHENSKLLCEVCSAAFNTRQSLRRHRIMVHSANTPFVCKFCGQKFFEKRSYYGHINKHMAVKPYNCSVCNLEFGYKYSLERHLLTCTNKDADKYKCNICQKQLKSAASLKAHTKGMHGPKVNKCICGKAFSWNSAMLRHEKSCEVAKRYK